LSVYGRMQQKREHVTCFRKRLLRFFYCLFSFQFS